MKKMLLITEGFYDYDDAMKVVFEQMGYDVTMFQADITLGYVEKLRHRPDLQAYMDARRKEAQSFLYEVQPYDTVLVICGHSLHIETFLEFRRRQKQAEFILYLWDDVARVRTFEALKDIFDRIYTFDWKDAEQYGLMFRPLFYLPLYCYSGQKKWRSTSSAGWLHSDRINVLCKILERTFYEDDTAYVYMLTGVYTMCKYRISRLIKHRMPAGLHISTKKLDGEASAQLLLESKTVIDIQHPTQRGLTIRTIESLAAHTKLITTNEQVRQYDFYRENNICIIDRENPEISRAWLEKPWVPVEESCVERYSIRQWAEDILNGTDNRRFMKDEEEVR